MSKGLNIQRRIVNRKKRDIVAEANYIVSCAIKLNARLVSFGSLLFFSTKNGDAWMLDHADGLANCLAKEREPQSIFIEESDENFKIEWKAEYQIENEVFKVFDRSSRKVTHLSHKGKTYTFKGNKGKTYTFCNNGIKDDGKKLPHLM